MGFVPNGASRYATDAFPTVTFSRWGCCSQALIDASVRLLRGGTSCRHGQLHPSRAFARRRQQSCGDPLTPETHSPGPSLRAVAKMQLTGPAPTLGDRELAAGFPSVPAPEPPILRMSVVGSVAELSLAVV